MQVKLVLCDVDGTLIKSGDPVHFKAYSSAMETVMGVKARIPVKFTSGQTDRRTLIDFLKRYGFSRRQIETNLEEIFAAMKVYYKQRAPRDMRQQLIPGIRVALKSLKDKGYILGLISGGVGEIVWEKMMRADLKRFFVGGAFGDEAEERADLVRLAIKKISELTNCKFGSNEVVIVGDTPRDIESARVNEIEVIAVASGLYSLPELAKYQPDYLLRNPSGLASILT